MKVILFVLGLFLLFVSLDPTGFVEGQASISTVGQLESGSEYYKARGAQKFWNAVPTIAALSAVGCFVGFVLLYIKPKSKPTK